jgi:hypothetical protein
MNLDLSNKESVVAWLMDGQPVMQGLVNMGKLLALVSQALEQDGHSVDQDTLSAIFIDPINDYEQATGNSAGDPEKQRILPTMVYLYYADWESAITKLIGVPCVDIQPDWTVYHRNTSRVMKALSYIGIEVLLAGSKSYEEEHGHSMLEVFMASCETGEDFDQSRARLTATRKGLQPL